jgi:XRN 5'-3' exonuclease N-terminus
VHFEFQSLNKNETFSLFHHDHGAPAPGATRRRQMKLEYHNLCLSVLLLHCCCCCWPRTREEMKRRRGRGGGRGGERCCRFAGVVRRAFLLLVLAVFDGSASLRSLWTIADAFSVAPRKCSHMALLPKSETTVGIISNSRASTTALMGIRGFRAWFESQFPSALLEIPSYQQDHHHHHSSSSSPSSNNSNSKPSSSSSSSSGANDTFDHVLIDVNQYLHVAMRKSRSEEHGLVLFMKELDACVRTATPLQSLVLAMDGPPSAAKLATQRKRRYAIVLRSASRLRRFDLFDDNNSNSRGESSNDTTNTSDSSSNSSNNNNNNSTVNATTTLSTSKTARKRRKLSKSARATKQRKAAAEKRTLALTPGTALMETVCQTVL